MNLREITLLVLLITEVWIYFGTTRH